MACPARAKAAGLVVPFANTKAMNARLTEIARTVACSAHAMLVIDGAGWQFVVLDYISLVALPPYSPHLNPVKNA